MQCVTLLNSTTGEGERQTGRQTDRENNFNAPFKTQICVILWSICIPMRLSEVVRVDLLTTGKQVYNRFFMNEKMKIACD